MLAAWIRLLRPRHWTKNGLVAAAPAAAGLLTDPVTLRTTAAAVVVWTLVSGGAYCINDACDAAADRVHPSKRHRPVASGQVSASVAWGSGALLVLLALAVAGLLGPPGFAGLVVVYAAITTGYSAGLKRVPGVDLAVIVAAYLLRAVAGAVVADVVPSRWFLSVVALAALAAASGKRTAELREAGPRSPRHRPVLDHYTEGALRLCVTAASAAAVGTYAMWAGSRPVVGAASASLVVSVLALTVAFGRYVALARRGLAGEPERLLGRDPLLTAAAVSWGASFLAAVHA